MVTASELLRKVGSWQELQSRIEGLATEKQKGGCFELFVRHYLTLEPRYATKLEQVWLLSEVPPEVSRLLNLPQSDEGIDLVARTNEGRYWAIQAKYRGPPDASLTRPELSTFTDLALTICKNFDTALVCTTADRFSHKLELYGTRLTLCTGDAWRQLDREFFARLASALQGKLTRPTPLVPRPHQESAIANARRHFVDENQARGKMIMPCGTGKSLAGFWITRELGASLILVAVPSLALVRQTLLVWAREYFANGVDVHWIAVCSDPSVGDPEADDPILLTQDLGVDVATDVDQIAQWLRQDAPTKVVFSTYQSGRVLAEAAHAAGITFDLGILDEAHRTVGKRDSLFGHLLFDENVPIRRRVFMTATERLYARASNNQIVGMENSAIYGSVFEMLSFRAALEATPPILSDYRVVTLVVTREEIDALIERNSFVRPDGVQWSDEVEAQMLAAVVALRKAMVEFPISHAISFHRSIAKAKAFAANQIALTSARPEFGSLEVYHVSGSTKTADRDLRLRQFAEAVRALVTNARCLSEGVDVPDIDCVLFADPKRSTVDIVQAVGRALRPSPDGGLAYILIPVEVDDIDDTTQLEEAVFGSVLNVLRALAANDERIAEYFRTVQEGRPWSGQIPFEIKLPDGVRLSVDKFVQSIELRCWSRLGKLAWRPFPQAREFVRSLGLQTRLEWTSYHTGRLTERKPKPYDIPTAPDMVYKESGWAGWADWIGSGSKRKWRPFEEARSFARTTGITSKLKWFDFATGRLKLEFELPDDIPSNAAVVYKNEGWEGWGDFLGTGKVYTRDWQPYADAREFVRRLNLKTRKEWKEYCQGRRPDLPTKPEDIPTNVERIYANKGWKGQADWLGHDSGRGKARVFLPFPEARAFVHSLNLAFAREWSSYCKGRIPGLAPRPANIPSTPAKIYRHQGWAGIPDWIGKKGAVKKPNVLKAKWRPFKDARRFVQALKLKNIKEWHQYCRNERKELGTKPKDIPTSPNSTYKGFGWTSYYDWLGTQEAWRPFPRAREFIRSLRLKSNTEWRLYIRGRLPGFDPLPEDIPTAPEVSYKDLGWKNWADWLGNEKPWRPLAEAREFVRSLGLRTTTSWKAYCRGHFEHLERRPADIPAQPSVIYKDSGWISWEDWLGHKSKRGRKPRSSD